MSLIKVGLIGCGYWGRNYIRNFEHLDNVQMYACCDSEQANLDLATKTMHSIRPYSIESDIINDPEVNALVIATPATSHFEIAKSALSAGKHCLVEKPLAMTVKQSKELVETAESNGVILMVGHIMEFNPAVVKLRDIVQKKELGNVHYMYLTRTNLGLIRQDVNVMWDLAPHDISVVHYVMDKVPVRVSAKAHSYVLKSIEDVAFLLLEFDDGAVAHIHVSWLDPCKIRRVTVVGDNNMAVFDDIESLDKIRLYDTGVTFDAKKEKTFEDFGSYQLSYRYGDIRIPRIELAEPLRSQCTHFIECIENGTRPQTDGTNGVNVVKVLEAATRSIKNDGRFELIDE